MCTADHNKILHMSWPCHCCDVCKSSLWSAEYVMNKSIANLHWISISIEILPAVTWSRMVGCWYSVHSSGHKTHNVQVQVFYLPNRNTWNNLQSVYSLFHQTISHNAQICNRFSHRMVHCGIWDWCIMGFVPWVYYEYMTPDYLTKWTLHFLIQTWP